MPGRTELCPGPNGLPAFGQLSIEKYSSNIGGPIFFEPLPQQTQKAEFQVVVFFHVQLLIEDPIHLLLNLDISSKEYKMVNTCRLENVFPSQLLVKQGPSL